MYRRILVLLSLVGLAFPLAAEQPDSYSGFTLDLLAESLARYTTFRTEVGETAAQAKFEAWLSTKNLTRRKYDMAYAAWWERFAADKSGQLEARFHRINAEYTQRFNFADAPDRREEAREGFTLDKYAQAIVAMTRNGWSVDRVVKEFGFKNEAHFDRVNAAWIAAMRDDKSFATTQQYAALYQKYAGEDFAREQEATVARALAEHRGRPAEAAEKPVAPTIEEYAAGLDDKILRDRWHAAGRYAHECDMWLGPHKSNPKDPRAPYCSRTAIQTRLLPVLLDAIEHFDDETVGEAVNAVDAIVELKLKTSDIKLDLQRALNRMGQRLQALQAAFAPIQNKAVPERIVLRAKIDAYEAGMRDLRAALDKW